MSTIELTVSDELSFSENHDAVRFTNFEQIEEIGALFLYHSDKSGEILPDVIAESTQMSVVESEIAVRFLAVPIPYLVSLLGGKLYNMRFKTENLEKLQRLKF